MQVPVLSKTESVRHPLRLQAVAGIGVEWNEYSPGELGRGEVEIAPVVSYISAGTELVSIRGLIDKEVGAFQPTPLGYSQSGVVIRVGTGVAGLAPGDRVAAIGAGAWHATRTRVAQNVVIPLPKEISFDVAATLAMLCFSLEGVYKAQARIGQNVVVFGAGMMGQVTARLFALMGCRVAVIDPDAFRLSFLPQPIDRFTLNDAGWAGLERWAKPYGVEAASFCCGGDATMAVERLKKSMSCAPDGVPHGKIIFPGGTQVRLMMAAHMGNIQFISSSKAGPGYRDPEWEREGGYPQAYTSHTVRRNMETLLRLIQMGSLGDLDTLITHRFAIAETKAAYDLLMAAKEPVLGVLLKYPSQCL